MTNYHSLESSDPKWAEDGVLGLEIEHTNSRDVIIRIAPKVASALARIGVRSAEELASFLNTFPSEIARVLNWDVKAVVRARECVLPKLRGIVEDVYLDPPTQSVSYGAVDPDRPSRPSF
jgi:hypothetical protein